MLRPATTLRAFAAPSRLALPKTASPSITLAARHYSTPSESASPAPTTTTTTSTTPPPVTPEAPPAAFAPTPTASSQPYTVLRTSSNQLAVYQLAKRGGNKKLTLIKKVEGDRTRFQSALAQELGVEEKTVVVNNLTGHVLVKVSTSVLYVFAMRWSEKRWEG